MIESSDRLRFLLVALALLVSPHLFHLHWSHILLFVGFWLWRWLGVGNPRLLPRGPWLPLLTLGATVVVLVSRRGAIDLTTSTGLFVAGLGLKLMELKGERDLHFVVLLGWFVALTQFLYDQSLWMGLYAFAAVILLTGVLVQFNSVRQLSWRPLARTVLGLLLPALPMTVLLFLLFPRPYGGFIRLPFDSRSKTGLAEILEPGAVARLAVSREVAFRVDFDAGLPPPERRYWRAQVFWRFDGRRWLPSTALRRPVSTPLPGRDGAIRYQVTVEPHHRRWLFSLGMPGSIPPVARMTREGVLEARFPVDERLRYRVVSYGTYRFPPLSETERNLALQLPGQPSKAVRELVERLRRRADRPRDFADAVLAYFRDQGFRYTLHPGTLGPRFIDRFLFDTRAGFCEHYASAFAYLMRAAGIPSRVVGGYLGGFVNPRGRFLEVYQANAHAWAEIWVEGEGWVRYDPTQAVAPRYVDQVRDLSDPLPVATLRWQLQGIPVNRGAGDFFWRGLGRELQIFWSDLDHRWHLWVLSYDRGTQDRLFLVLRTNWPKLALLTAALLALIWWRRGRPGESDPLVREYQRFLRRLQRQGIVKAPHETALAFAERACRHWPDQAQRIRQVTEVFIQARYGRKSPERAARILRQLAAKIGE